jgi:hypothetical protein
MDDSSYIDEIFGSRQEERNHYHSWKEHLKLVKFEKFGCKLL